MLDNIKARFEDLLIKHLDKLKEKNLKVPKNTLLKGIILYIGYILIGKILPIISIIYLAFFGFKYFKNNLLPLIRVKEIELIEEYLEKQSNKNENNIVHEKTHTNITKNYQSIKENTKKRVTNFYTDNISKFKNKFAISNEKLGDKANENCYRMTSKQIIQDYISVKEAVELKETESMKVKTKIK